MENNAVNIGILEIRRHIPVLYSFMKVCKTRNTKVTVFTTEELYSRLKTYNIDFNEFNFVIKKKHESTRSFLKRVGKICDNNIDLLFVNTIHETVSDLLCYLNFKPVCKKILVVHHVNAWLKPKLVFKLLHPLRTLDTNLSSVLIKKFVFPSFDAINVIYKPVREYIIHNMSFDNEIFTIPTSIFENVAEKKQEDKTLKIVIPGLIQEHRKDYHSVLPVFEELFEQFKERLELLIPGMPVGRYGQNIKNICKKMQRQGYKVVVFDDFVPEKRYNEILTDCDVILAPIRIKTRADGEISEYYGKTVGSGVVYNAIKYAKPIIVPSEFNMLKELGNSTLKYGNAEELKQHLQNLIENKNMLNNLKKESLKNAEKYSLKNLQEYFEKNILSWLKQR
jgi:hypothetical protein